MATHYDVFLSYQHEDKQWASKLVEALSEAGIRVWSDMELNFGDVLSDKIEQALHSSDYTVFVLNRESVRSNWTAAELGAALALGKPMIPVVASDVPWEDIPGPVRIRKYLPLGDPKAVAEEVARTITSGREPNSHSE